MNRMIIKKPWISEKATMLSDMGKYVFLVDLSAKTAQIKEAVEKIYKVHVVGVNVTNIRNNKKNIRKATVELKKGEKIDILPH